MSRSMEVRSLEDLSFIAEKCSHVLTLFSGGVDSSYLLSVLAKYKCKVSALVVDLGDGVNQEDLHHIASYFRAELRVIDGRSIFAEDAVLPAIQAHAKYMGIYPISSSLSRPIIARLAVNMAQQLGCDAILHTANQSQNSLRRLNGALKQLDYKGYIGSPYEYSALSREEKIASLCKDGLERFQARGISGDANLWVREYESGTLDNPEDFNLEEKFYKWTSINKEQTESKTTIRFEAGRPTSLNGQILPLVDLIGNLNLLAGRYGIGRFSGLEHLEGGEKVLEVREAPAALLLMEAYRHIETAVLDAEVIREKISLEQVWVREAIEGRWFGPMKSAITGFISVTARQINGTVTFKMRPGAADVSSIRAQSALYLTDRDWWEKMIAKERGSRSLKEIFPTKNQNSQKTVSI